MGAAKSVGRDFRQGVSQGGGGGWVSYTDITEYHLTGYLVLRVTGSANRTGVGVDITLYRPMHVGTVACRHIHGRTVDSTRIYNGHYLQIVAGKMPSFMVVAVHGICSVQPIQGTPAGTSYGGQPSLELGAGPCDFRARA